MDLIHTSLDSISVIVCWNFIETGAHTIFFSLRAPTKVERKLKCSLCQHLLSISRNPRVTLVKICGSASGNREKQQHYFGQVSAKRSLQTGYEMETENKDCFSSDTRQYVIYVTVKECL